MTKIRIKVATIKKIDPAFKPYVNSIMKDIEEIKQKKKPCNCGKKDHENNNRNGDIQ